MWQEPCQCARYGVSISSSVSAGRADKDAIARAWRQRSRLVASRIHQREMAITENDALDINCGRCGKALRVRIADLGDARFVECEARRNKWGASRWGFEPVLAGI